MMAQDKQLRQGYGQPPQYEDVLTGSGVSISSSQMSGSRGTSIAGNERPVALVEHSSGRS